MLLPVPVRNCIDALEAAGFAAYAVGGCVRDSLLGRTPHDYDLCTAATPEQMQQIFAGYRLVLAGVKHGTVGVVTDSGVVEITTFRTEGGYQDGRHPDWVEFVTEIEQDLARRDFTVNAMAFSPTRGYADPFGGQADLEWGILRAVGDPETRFREDALRILRGVRFALRFSLTPEEMTLRTMLNLAPLMDGLARERVFEELCKLLPLVTARDLMQYAPVITQVIPELKSAIGFDQRSSYHAYPLYTHIAHVVEHVPGSLPLRWAALLHDIGKVDTFTLDEKGCGHFYGHAKLGAEKADAVLRRLKAPTALREQVVTLIGQHMTPLEPDKKLLRRRVSRLGMQTVQQLLELQQADFGSKGREEECDVFFRIRILLAEIEAEDACLTVKDLAVNGRDLMALGYSGKALGAALERLLELVLDETLANEKDALLCAAKDLLHTPEVTNP